jgi:biopolymer transport protein ExbD
MALQSDINVTPLIDVILVLLIVFILSMQIRSILQVNVPPPAERPRSGPTTSHIVLELQEDGSYAISGRAVAFSELGARLRELNAGGARDLIFVRAAPRRRYGEVIRAVDIAKGAGWRIVGYIVRRCASEPRGRTNTTGKDGRLHRPVLWDTDGRTPSLNPGRMFWLW